MRIGNAYYPALALAVVCGCVYLLDTAPKPEPVVQPTAMCTVQEKAMILTTEGKVVVVPAVVTKDVIELGHTYYPCKHLHLEAKV